MDFNLYENWSDGAYSILVVSVLEDKWRLLRKVPDKKSKHMLFDDFDETLKGVNIECLEEQERGLLETINKCLDDEEFRGNIFTEPEIGTYFDAFESCLRYGGVVPLTENDYDFLKKHS